MEITINGKAAELPALAAAAAGNSFPDILIFASGKVATQGMRSKIRVTISDGSNTLKAWTKTVEYTDAQGTVYGNFTGAEVISRDDLTGNINIEVQIDNVPVPPAGLLQIDAAPLAGLAATFENGAGVTATAGLLVMV